MPLQETLSDREILAELSDDQQGIRGRLEVVRSMPSEIGIPFRRRQCVGTCGRLVPIDAVK
jgi:hypothetical protein